MSLRPPGVFKRLLIVGAALITMNLLQAGELSDDIKINSSVNQIESTEFFEQDSESPSQLPQASNFTLPFFDIPMTKMSYKDTWRLTLPENDTSGHLVHYELLSNDIGIMLEKRTLEWSMPASGQYIVKLKVTSNTASPSHLYYIALDIEYGDQVIVTPKDALAFLDTSEFENYTAGHLQVWQPQTQDNEGQDSLDQSLIVAAADADTPDIDFELNANVNLANYGLSQTYPDGYTETFVPAPSFSANVITPLERAKYNPLSRRQIDMHLPGPNGLDIVIGRSFFPNRQLGSFGNGWSFIGIPTLHKSINYWYFTDETGQSVAFARMSNVISGDGTNRWRSARGDTLDLNYSTGNGSSVHRITSIEGKTYDIIILTGGFRSHVSSLPLKITDHYGNTISFTGSVADGVTKITRSDGVYVDLIGNACKTSLSTQYTNRCIERVSSSVATFSYTYANLSISTFDSIKILSAVTRPDGTRTTFDYCINSGTSSVHQTNCGHGFDNGFDLKKIQFSTGGSVSYSVNLATSGTVGATITKTECGAVCGSWQFTNRPANRVTGASVFDWNITAPESMSLNIKAGNFGATNTLTGIGHELLREVSVYQSGALLKKELLDYGTKRIFSYVGSGNRDDFSYVTKRTITLNGTTSYLSYSGHDTWGYPSTYIESGPAGSRTTSLSWKHQPTGSYFPQIGLLTEHSLSGHGTVKYGYNERGKIASINRYGLTESYYYNNQGNLDRSIDPNGAVTNYGYSGSKCGIPVTITNPLGHTSSNVIDSACRITSSTNLNGDSIRYTYDGLNRVTYVEPPLGNAIRHTYTATTTTTTQGSSRVVTTVEGLGKTVSVNNNGITTSYSYDGLNHLKFESYPNQAAGITRVYDVLGRMVKQTFPDGAYTAHTYSGTSVSIRDARGNTTTQSLSYYGLPEEVFVTKITEPAGTVTDLTYSVGGLLTRVSQGGLSRSYGYNSYWQMTSLTEPERQVVSYGYDKNGNMTSFSIAGSGGSGIFSFDANNRLVEENYSSGERVAYAYDRQGSVTEAHSYWIGGQALRNYTYNKNGQITSERLRVSPLDGTLFYEYDGNGALSATISPTGKRLDYAPNVLGQPTKMGEFARDMTWHPSGKASFIRYGNNTTWQQTLDNRLRPATITSSNLGLVNRSYSYDANSNVLSVTDRNDSSASRSYSYDTQNRLTGATGGGTFKYSYDTRNNLTSMSSPKGNLTYSYNASNQLSSVTGRSFIYDNAGNIINDDRHSYQYSPRGRMIAVDHGMTARYYYDAHGNRVYRLRNGDTNYIMFYSLSGQLIGEYAADGLRYREYVTLGTDVLAHRELWYDAPSRRTLEQIMYLYNDPLSSWSTAADANGTKILNERYSPYGDLEIGLAPLKTHSMGYTGKPRDPESDLIYMNARYYSPVIGRFYSVDPVDFFGSRHANSFNRYAYANNNPMKYIDPSGESAAKAIGTVLVGLGHGDLGYIKEHFSYDLQDGYDSENWKSTAFDDTNLIPARFLQTKLVGFVGFIGAKFMRSAKSADEVISAANVFGRIQSRINISNKGWKHTLNGHFNPARAYHKSQFTISETELKTLLGSKNVIEAPVRALETGNFARTITLDKPVGKLAEKWGGGTTNTFSVVTDKAGNLLTVTPGVL